MDRRSYILLATAGVISGCLGDDDTTETDDGDDVLDTDDDTDADDVRADGDDHDDDEADLAFDRRWDVDLPGSSALQSDFAIGTDALFVGHDNGLTAIETDEGTERWTRDDWTRFYTVAVDDQGVVALTDDGFVQLNGDDGQTIWSTSVAGSEADIWRGGVTEPSVLVSTDEETAMFDRETGDRIAEYDTIDGDVVTSATHAVLVVPNQVTSVDPDTGETLWESDVRVSRDGTIADDRFVAVHPGDLESGTIRAVDLGNGRQLWETDIVHPGTGFVNVAVTDGVATFITGDSREGYELYAHDMRDGSELWSETLGDLTSPARPPAVDDGVILSEAEDEIIAREAQTGEVLGSTERPFSIDAISAREGVYYQWSGNEIVAYDLNQPSSTSRS